MSGDITDDAALAAVRSIPHPRGHCCEHCAERRDTTNNAEAWAIVRAGNQEAATS